MVLFKGGKVFLKDHFEPQDVLVAHGKIMAVGHFHETIFSAWPEETETVECPGFLLLPGLIDPHLHLSGGSGEGGGFFSQSPPVLVSECVRGGVTTVVGTLGVDTTTKTMADLIAKVKSYNEIGLTAYAYTGGYDTPPKTLTDSVRKDVLFIQEILGVGEIAIADPRAPEPSPGDLARSCIDAYVGGLLSGKAGVSHFHVGEGERRLQSVRDLLTQHQVQPGKLHLTHIERSAALVDEGIELARRGCFIDFDIHERDLHHWLKYYRERGGPLGQLTVSSDAGISSPQELWQEIQKCVFEYGFSLAELLPHFTENPARVLQLPAKAAIAKNKDADLVIVDEKTLEIHHVLAGGKFFLRDGKLTGERRIHLQRRGYDIYEIHGQT